jgi:hypothetical protein
MSWLKDSLFSSVPRFMRVVSKSFWTFGITRWEATQRVMAAKLPRLAHKIAIQLHLVAESYTICSSRSKRPVRKLLDTPSYVKVVLIFYCTVFTSYPAKLVPFCVRSWCFALMLIFEKSSSSFGVQGVRSLLTPSTLGLPEVWSF